VLLKFIFSGDYIPEAPVVYANASDTHELQFSGVAGRVTQRICSKYQITEGSIPEDIKLEKKKLSAELATAVY
jgi:hypothetical protein